jgi:hypothetical protein
MGLGLLVKRLWQKKAKTMIVAGALLSATSLVTAIAYSSDKDYAKTVGYGVTSLALAFGTGWYSRKRYDTAREEKIKKHYASK